MPASRLTGASNPNIQATCSSGRAPILRLKASMGKATEWVIGSRRKLTGQGMTINLDSLERSAIQLRNLLERYQHQAPAAALVLRELNGVLERAAKREITAPMKPRDIPGHRYFTETPLGAYRDLEAAYASFYVALIDGQSSEAFRRLQAEMKRS